MINILEGKAADAVEPFPVAHAHRVWGWMQSSGADFRKLVGLVAQDERTFTESVVQQLVSGEVRSFALIDKLDEREEIQAPVIGIVTVEPLGVSDALIHVAARRGRSKQVQESLDMIVDHIFESEPQLQRLSARLPSTNRAAKMRAHSLGFASEVEMSYMGLTRSERGK